MDKELDQQRDETMDKDTQKTRLDQEGVQEHMNNDEGTCMESNGASSDINEEDMENIKLGLDEDPCQDHMESPMEGFDQGGGNIPIQERLIGLVKTHRKIFLGVGISLSVLFFIYLGIAYFFTSRFYFGTTINGVNVSGKKVEEVKGIMGAELDAYTLTLKGRGGKTQKIRASEVGLRYRSEEDLLKLHESQNPYHWVVGCFNRDATQKTMAYAYDEIRLKDRIQRLPYLDEKNIVDPRNPSFRYVKGSYRIIDGLPGNRLDVDVLTRQVAKAILRGDTELDLEATSCYIQPKYTPTSSKTLRNKEVLDRYVSTEITYELGGRKEILNGDTIHQWIHVNEDFEVELDVDQVRAYVDELAKKYNTVGRTRKFKTSLGKTVKVGGGDYGWAIDRPKEVETLVAAIKYGERTTRQPVYHQTAFAKGPNDIGDTYVEIHLAGQHIWFYRKGKLIVHGDIVTGDMSKNYTTPRGIYRLKYKAKNVVLRGPGYAAPVTFWMPFNGGIGIHDASWRRSFGGNIYKTNGSHGCINCPYNVAKDIYNNIQPGTPVICY